MSPFLQELVSIISIIIGVIVLTAWVMWILLRPSGNSKAKDFAQESARNGLTRCVMENNELKNTITRLERELKVLMSAGYGHKSASRAEEGQVEIEGAKVKDEGGRGKGKGERVETKVQGEKTREKETELKGKTESLKKEDEGRKIRDEEERLKEKGERVATNEERQKINEKGGRVETKDQGQKNKDDALKVKDEGLKKQEAEVAANAVPKPVDEASSADQTKVAPAASEAVSTPPAVKPVQKTVEMVQAAPRPEAHRVVDEAEKKKIAEYMANVEKATERQKKEIEALEAMKRRDEEATRYPNNNLKKIKGIGPHLEGKLKKAGITSYQQIADFTDDDIRRISEQIGSFPRRIKREQWVKQARLLLGKG
jgi:predicted flap endonuclease-1-like 5' DNA nuclease